MNKIIDKRHLGKATARTIDLDYMGDEAKRIAINSSKTHVSVQIGGTVANCYGYPAKTDAAVAVAWPDGRVLVIARRISANKATLSGALASLLGDWARPFRDGRFTRTDLAENMIVEKAELLIVQTH